MGRTGALPALTTIAAGIFVKTLAMWIWPYELMTAFLLLMCVKSVGLALTSVQLYEQATP